MSPVHHTDDSPTGCLLVALALAVVVALGGGCLWGVAAWMQARGSSL